MTTRNTVARRQLSLLQLASELSNVSKSVGHYPPISRLPAFFKGVASHSTAQ